MRIREYAIMSLTLLVTSSCRRDQKKEEQVAASQGLSADLSEFGPMFADYSQVSNTLVLKRDVGEGLYDIDLVNLSTHQEESIADLNDPFLIRLSPDGQRLFFVSNKNHAASLWRPSLKVLPEGKVFELAAPDIRSVATLPAWNSDSSILAYVAATGGDGDLNNHVRLIFRDPSRPSQAVEAKGITKKLSWQSTFTLVIVEEDASARQRLRAVDVRSGSELWSTDWSFSQISSVTQHPQASTLLVTAKFLGDPTFSILQCNMGICKPISDGASHEINNAVLSGGNLFLEEVVEGRLLVRSQNPSWRPDFLGDVDEATHTDLVRIDSETQAFTVRISHPSGSWALQTYDPSQKKYELRYQFTPQHPIQNNRHKTLTTASGIDVPVEFWESSAAKKAGLFVHVSASPRLWLKSVSDPWLVSALTRRGFDVAFVNVSGSGGYGDTLAKAASMDVQANQLYDFLSSMNGKYQRTIVLGMSAGTAVVTRSITAHPLPNVDAGLVSVVQNCMAARDPAKNNGKVTIFVPEEETNGVNKANLVADEIFRSSFQGGVNIVKLKGEGHVVRHRESWTTVLSALLQ